MIDLKLYPYSVNIDLMDYEKGTKRFYAPLDFFYFIIIFPPPETYDAICD